MREYTIGELSGAMARGEMTAHGIAQAYLERIAEIDQSGPRLNSVIEINPDALAIADSLDRERRETGPRGPLHGIPILIKDNLDTADRMQTTAGSLALEGHHAQEDSTVAAKLRSRGRADPGQDQPERVGQLPLQPLQQRLEQPRRADPEPLRARPQPVRLLLRLGRRGCREPVRRRRGHRNRRLDHLPLAHQRDRGHQAHPGLVSRAGIIPIAHSQDTAGPMARTVADAALLLAAIAGPDPRDGATADAAAHLAGYASELRADGLRGARLGVPRNFFGFNPAVDAIMEQCIAALRDAGAEVVDPVEVVRPKELDECEMEVLLYEFHADLDAYLAGHHGRVRSLAEVIAFNEAHADRVMPHFGQELMKKAQEKGPLTEEKYRTALATDLRLSRDEGIDATLARHGLDALVEPSGGPAWLTDHIAGDHYTGGNSSPAAIAGYPSITVPAGYVRGLPIGLTFVGTAWTEPQLIRFAYAFEQATKVRRPPEFLPSAG